MSKKRSIPDVFAELREIVGDAFDGDISDIRGMECTRSPAMTSEQTERMSEADWSGHVDADGNVLSWEYANQLYAENKQLRTDLAAMTERAEKAERSSGLYQKWWEDAERKLHQAEAENARLREALEDTAKHLDYVHHELVTEDQDTVQGLRNQITQALHGSPAAGGKDEDE